MRGPAWVATIGAIFALTGCFDLGPKLSQDEEKALDAVMYLFTGLEDNLDDTDGKGMPWQRGVKGRNLEYWRISPNFGLSSRRLVINDRHDLPSQFLRFIGFIFQNACLLI
jgi:hypothetical protein